MYGKRLAFAAAYWWGGGTWVLAKPPSESHTKMRPNDGKEVDHS